MLSQLDKLTPEVVKVLEPYARKLLELDGQNITCLAVYGSAAGSNFVPGKSNINLVVVAAELTLKELKIYQKLSSKQRKQIIIPLFLTQEHIQSSLDTFPMELLEIRDNHITIFGQDLFSGLMVESEHLRLECEREIKSRLIRLRQVYPEVGGKTKSLNDLLVQSLNSILPIMRSLMYLGDQSLSPEISKDKILSQINTVFNVDKKVFKRILELKAIKKVPPLPELESIFDQYLQQLQNLAQIVDQIKC